MDLFKKDKIEIINLALEQIRDAEKDMSIGKSLLEKQKDITYGRVLNEEDFYPPADNRVLHSAVEDIDNGDNFAEFTHDFFELCDEEEIYD